MTLENEPTLAPNHDRGTDLTKAHGDRVLRSFRSDVLKHMFTGWPVRTIQVGWLNKWRSQLGWV